MIIKLPLKKIKYLNFILLIITITANCLAQNISLFQSIQKALKYNETILFGAQRNYLSAQSQLKVSESTYRTKLDLSLSSENSYSRTLSGDNYLYSRSQTTTPYMSLNRTFLSPFGSRTSFGLGYQTQMSGSGLFYSFPQFTLTYQQPLSISGIQSGHMDIINARQNFIQSEMSYQLQKESLILSVINSYFLFWQAIRNVEQNEQDLESTRRVLEIAELRLKAGQISEFEVMNSRVQFRVSEDNLKVSKNSLKTQKRNFLRLLGQDMDQEVILENEIELDTVAFDLEYAIQTAYQNRLEVKQDEINLELADLSLKQTLSARYPNLYLNGSYTLSSQYDMPLGTALSEYPNINWNVQATVSFPLIDGGLVSHQVQIARYSYNILDKNLELLKEDITIEIEDYFRSLQLNQNRIESLLLNLEIAREALKIAELRFSQGQISTTEIENIRQRYLNAQQSLNNAKISYITECAQLYKAMGLLDEWVDNLK